MKLRECGEWNVYYLEEEDIDIGARFLVKQRGEYVALKILEKTGSYVKYSREGLGTTWKPMDEFIGKSGIEVYDRLRKSISD